MTTESVVWDVDRGQPSDWSGRLTKLLWQNILLLERDGLFFCMLYHICFIIGPFVFESCGRSWTVSLKPLFQLCRAKICNMCSYSATKSGDGKVFDGTPLSSRIGVFNVVLAICNILLEMINMYPYASWGWCFLFTRALECMKQLSMKS